ncbi:hypothetical protein Bbelb_317410 [Branchiostoma belcheri]|nr:hypothetical protein Bbelb_317410 [Branchiostoma belcheri]
MTTPVTSVVSTTAAVSQTTAGLVDMSNIASTSLAGLLPLGEQQHDGFPGATHVPPRTEPDGQGSQHTGQNFVIDDAALFQHINSMVSQAVAQSLQAQGFAEEQVSQPIVSEQDSFSTSEDSDHGRRSRSKHRFKRTYADRFRERSRSPKKAIPAASQAAGRGRKANQPTASLSASPGASSRLESHNDESIDIRDAYFHIPIHESFRRLLRFRWKGQIWEFQALPFGLNCAPRVFTKVTKPILAVIRSRGIRIVIYLDDILVLGRTFAQCKENVDFVVSLLQSLGFLINREKSQLVPVQEIVFLGMVINSIHLTLSLPEDKGSGDSLLHLTQGALSELTTWVECLESWNGKSFLPPPRQTCLTLTSDASLAGWGATCGHQKTGGRWTDEESKLHINELELKAAFFAVEIWKWALARKLHLPAEHLPGVLNTVADAESRSFNDHTEWTLRPDLFKAACRHLKFQPQIDMFASRLNKQLPLFCSRRADPEAWGVDALFLPWHNIKLYVFPPVCLLARILAKIKREQAEALVIAPFWPFQAWFPLLRELAVADPFFLPVEKSVLSLPGQGDCHPLWRCLRLAAWLVSGRP